MLARSMRTGPAVLRVRRVRGDQVARAQQGIGGVLRTRPNAGIRRTIGTAQVGKAPTLVADLKKMLEALPATRVGLRDRALLLLGFAGAFRRAEAFSVLQEKLNCLDVDADLNGATDPNECVMLRVVDEPWPFPPHYALAPQRLAALDLLDYPDVVATRVGHEVLSALAVPNRSCWRAGQRAHAP